jgi:hypothetical protein
MKNKQLSQPTPITQIVPVADLYELKMEGGPMTRHTKSSYVASEWTKAGPAYTVQEYVKLERLQEAYTAPPAPAPAVIILDKVSCEGFDPKDWVEARNLGQCEGWNAYRAEMLAQSVSQGYKLNSPEIPDSWIACTEQTPDADGAYWCWFGKEEPSVIQQRVCIWINRNNEWCDSSVTHWMPLPAAPAQGEK